MPIVERPFLVTDDGAHELQLGERRGQGSTAIVYDLLGVPRAGDEQLVAKMYKRRPPDGLMALVRHGWDTKLTELSREGSAGRHHHLFSMPVAALHRTAEGRDIVGAAMYRANARLVRYQTFKQSQVPLRVKVDGALSLAERVSQLHENSLVLSDFSGSNLLFTTTGFCSVIDGDSFGLLSSDRSSVVVSPPSGTPNFLPPERHRHADWRCRADLLLSSDVFVCTSLVVELLVSVHPFAGTVIGGGELTRQANVDSGTSWLRRSDVILPANTSPKDRFESLPQELQETTHLILFAEPSKRPGMDSLMGCLRRASEAFVICGCGTERFSSASCPNPNCTGAQARTDGTAKKTPRGATPIGLTPEVSDTAETTRSEPSPQPPGLKKIVPPRVPAPRPPQRRMDARRWMLLVVAIVVVILVLRALL